MQRLPKYIQKSDGKLWLTEDERDHLKINYKVDQVLHEETSPYQHVMIVDSPEFGRMLVLDGAVQTTSMDGYIYNEMISHMPLSIHPNPRHVLIIGGGDCGAANEAAKYESVERIDMVEIDEAVVRVSKQFMPEVAGDSSDPRIRFHYADGVEFVKALRQEYDVIIVDSSDPVGPAVQLFEIDFYRNLHQALKEDGLMVCQSQSPIFQPEVMKQSYDRIGQIFPYRRLYTAVVPTYPGGLWSFTIGSKRKLPDPEDIVFNKRARYANEETLRTASALPAFLKEMLEQEQPAETGR